MEDPNWMYSLGPTGAASQRYAQGRPERQPYIDRARDNAALTIPYLFREEGANATTQQELPWNSGGAYALANMAAKLCLALYPVGQPPMKLKPGPETQQSLLQMAADDPDQAGDLAASIDGGLSSVEQEFVELMDEDGDRAKLAVGALRLLCGGNHAYQFKEGGKLRGIPLDRFVTWRDGSSELFEFVIEDSLSWETVPGDVRQHCLNAGYKELALGSGPGARNHPVLLYTHGYLMQGKWHVYQECYGREVEGSRYVRIPEALEYFFPGWVFLEGEHYARSYVENYLGDLQAVEGIWQTVQESAAAIAKFLTLVDPTGLTSKKTLAEARNGAVISGRKDDVHVMENSKGGDLQSVLTISERTERRLAAAFLLNSSIQRQGERVTAVEIRYMAGELEDAQAGAYSQQVVGQQQPYVKGKLFHAMKARRVTPLPMNAVKVTIVGGMGGLARNAELQALDTLVAGAMQTWGDEAGKRFNLTVYFKRRATALGVKVDGLLYSEEHLQQQQAQEQQMGLVSQLGPEALKQVGQNITSNQVAETNAAASSQPPPAEQAQAA